MSATDHISKRKINGIYEYVRRVPASVAHLDNRAKIVVSLGTRDEAIAREKARTLDQANDVLWGSLLKGDLATDTWSNYRSAVTLAQAKGFTYRPADELVSEAKVWDIVERVLAAREGIAQPQAAKAILGDAPAPTPRLSDLWTLYEQHYAASLEGMSANQMRKHKNPRLRAMAYAIEVLGDMQLGDITRADVLRFREWWTDKMKLEALKADTINRCFSDIKGMLTVIDNALHTNFGEVWERSRVKATNKTRSDKRPPYPADFVRTRFLAHGVLDSLNLEARMVVYLMIETGLRPGEACNLRPEDICLDAAIPHVAVTITGDRRIKNDYSERKIPLVGVAFWAMQQFPLGFPTYRDKEDTLSNTVNKALLAANLRPTKAHVLYSLRHTFADRLTAARVSDREHTDLMGHEFDRPDYGDGVAMEQKLQILNGIAFEWIPPAKAKATS